METILRASSTLPRPLQALLRSCQQWLAGPFIGPFAGLFTSLFSTPSVPAPARRPLAHTPPATQPARQWHGPVRTPPAPPATPLAYRRPLRCHTHANGRMALSGRMADVCAELERLAAHEHRH